MTINITDVVRAELNRRLAEANCYDVDLAFKLMDLSGGWNRQRAGLLNALKASKNACTIVFHCTSRSCQTPSRCKDRRLCATEAKTR